jgi:hypothetical protein
MTVLLNEFTKHFSLFVLLFKFLTNEQVERLKKIDFFSFFDELQDVIQN